uniref:Uncharacterized protein n=1 Tax=Oryza glumipatula TaxID=40148 RepID=A0A0E0B1N2_9ORYZ
MNDCRLEARQLHLYRRAATGVTSADPARHGCGCGNNERLQAGGAAAPPPLLIGSGRDVGGYGVARLRARRRRATTGGRRGGGASGCRSAPHARDSCVGLAR